MMPGIAGIMAGMGASAPSFGPTSYANPQGTGNRTAALVVTENIPSGGGDVEQMVNGAIVNNEFFFTGSALNGTQEIRIDFGTARLIDEFKWYQQNSSTHGTWQWEGSNDGSSWTTLGATFTLGGGTVTTYARANTNGYRYYRLLGVSGSTSGSPYLQEIEFKISP
jgi:hypothetical protein